MTLYAGTVADFGNSMAAAIEAAFAEELWNLKEATLPESSAQERHLLFAAIAQGVLGYLHDNQVDLALWINGDGDGGNVTFDYSTTGGP